MTPHSRRPYTYQFPWRPFQSTFVLLAAVLIGLLALKQPFLATAGGVGLLLLAFLTQVGRRLPRYALGLISIALIGYAFLGKGFSYLGVPPLFIGEVTLGLGMLAAVMSVFQGARLHHVTLLICTLVAFLIIGIVSTVPYIGTYQLDALRDAATWYYALFALVVAVLVTHLGRFPGAIESYGRVMPYFLIAAPVVLWGTRLGKEISPKWPVSNQEILDIKGGDLAVHLAGVVVFLLLGLQRLRSDPSPTKSGRRPLVARWSPWWWWPLILVSVGSLVSGRAALVSIGAAVLLVLLLRPISHWGRPLLVTALMLTAVLIVNPRFETSNGRELSVDGLVLALQSVGGNTGYADGDGTRTWRLDWWRKIENYTINGPYFWMGKGYGVNLANTDGFQVYSDESLRNPHSIHFSILGRSGVPGLASWIVLNVVFAFSLLMAFVRARAHGHLMWANVHLWLLAYWLAFIVNASFDVYIEGPQGGIWFWSVLGFGIAALELYRRGENI